MTSVSLDDAGARVAIGCRNGDVFTAEIDRPAELRRVGSLAQPVSLVSFSPDGELLAAADAGGTLLLWDLTAGALVQTCRHAGALVDVAWIARDRWMTLDGSGVLHDWAARAPHAAAAERLATIAYDRCARIGDTRRLAVVDTFEWDILDVATGATLRVVPPDFDPAQLVRYVGRVVPSRNGGVMLIYWDGGDVFDTATGALLHSFDRPLAPGAVDVSDDGAVVVVGSVYGRLLVRTPSGVSFQLGVTPDEIVAVDLSPDGKRVVFADLNGGFGVLDARDGALLYDDEDLERALSRVRP